MPYKSAKQRRFMHARHPQIAARWDSEYGGKVRKSDGYGSPAAGRRIEDDVEKRLGVAPVLARRAPAAGRGGRRTVTGVKKAYAMPAANLKALKGLAAQADQQAFKTAKPKPYVVKKPAYQVSKAGFSLAGASRGIKNAFGVARGGFKSGLAQSRGATGAAAKPRMGLGASVGAAKSPAMGRLGSMAQTAGANPLATGAVAGGGIGAGAIGMQQRPKPSMYAPPSPVYGGFGKLYVEYDGKGWRDDDGNRGSGQPFSLKHAKKVKRFSIGEPVGKRTADPENERRFRQGAGAAAAGVGGLELGRRGVQDVRRATRNARTLTEVDPFGRMKGAAAEGARKTHAARMASVPKGVLLTRRAGGKLAGATALLGTSGALIRNRNEERWD